MGIEPVEVRAQSLVVARLANGPGDHLLEALLEQADIRTRLDGKNIKTKDIQEAMAHADSATDEAFQNLADEYISDLTSFSPVYATLIGDHSADTRHNRRTARP